jgi:hypothetical protein
MMRCAFIIQLPYVLNPVITGRYCFSVFKISQLTKVTYMKTYIAIDQYGKTVHISAYTESDARQQAEELLGFGNVVTFREA